MYYQLFVMHADGSNVRHLTHPPGTAGRHRWSADGSLIGFSLFQGPDSGTYLFTIRPDGTDRRQLTFKLPLDVSPRQDLDPTWSPDGTRIAFSSNRFTYPELFVMSADGTNQVQLTRDGANGFVTFPAWSIDGKRIAYSRQYAGAYTIWLWDVAAGRSIPFVSGPLSVLGSSWRP